MQLFVLITNITMIKLDTVPDISVGRIFVSWNQIFSCNL